MPTHYKGCKEVVRALNAYINLARASDTLLARLSLHAEAHDLTLGQFGILELLLHLGPMYQTGTWKQTSSQRAGTSPLSWTILNAVTSFAASDRKRIAEKCWFD